MGDVVSKVGQNVMEAQDPPEVTSPHKPSKSAQIHAANENHQTSQGAMKAQTGRGRIKKLARELGQNQDMNSEA